MSQQISVKEEQFRVRSISHLNRIHIGDKSSSLRTVVPHNIVERMHLTSTDLFEWKLGKNKDEIIVKKL
jgi:hypothetical protein